MRILIPAAMLICLGCPTGPSLARHPLTVSAAGSVVAIQTDRSRRTGELLEIRDTALVIKSAKEVILVPIPVIRTVRFTNLEYWYGRDAHDEGTLASFKRLSRFPGGAPIGVIEEIVRRSGRPLLVQQR